MEVILDNNIKVIYKETTSKLTSISISVDAGACKEKDLLGLAHITEHMVYKGTKTKNEEEINKTLSSIFAFQNAMTNYPYVIYYGTLLNEDLEKGIELFSDLIINPIFDKKGFSEEMEVIKEELEEWDEEIEQYCEDKLFLNSFTNRRIKYPIIGRKNDLNSVNLEDIKEFYRENYSPSKTSIAIVSSMPFNKILEVVMKYFSIWEDNSNSEVINDIDYEISNFNTYKDKKEGTKIARVQRVFPINELTSKELKAFRLFNEYFGEGVNSILFDTLRTKNSLVYDVLTKISNERYIKLYKVNFSTSIEKLDKSIELLDNCISDIINMEGESFKVDISSLGKSLKLKRLFREEQNIIAAKELSTYSTMFGNYKIYNDEIEGLEDITINEILEVAKKVLRSSSTEIIYN
ncbi:insulinase family protein [Clostridium sartagoforme]|uniref:Insulinase family protein n=1 Tax=Clostridium sartagoforme TaxID=84031 RepID=A0A4S2DQ14_9CLOT|nr:pitrilysin family protein [Clostridium sartagoforme]TGY44517.1 insulinase family protein [Clostridium sartagoforme]